MKEAGKKAIAESIDWLLYKQMNMKQKQAIANLFTREQKQLIKQLITPGRKRKQLEKIERIKYRLYNLGFTERGLEDLQDAFHQDKETYLKRLAAWELALWYANQYTEEGARQCIKTLPYVLKGTREPEYTRRAAILAAESYRLLNENDKGKQLISLALKAEDHPDLYLAAASLEDSEAKRIGWINRVMDFYGAAPVYLDEAKQASAYDRLQAQPPEQAAGSGAAKVSVIIPAYNAGEGLGTAIESMLKQTWVNLEVLVVDDCSTDNTVEVAETFASRDSRVKVIKAEVNQGAYAARNLALKQATGDFITINDADDWSHPEKIAAQANHLMENEKIIANFSQQARATEALTFYRRGKPGVYIFANMSSFMFRRVPVMEKLGYWDTVRFAGDSEFVKRVKKVFGEKAVVELPTPPFSFQRQTASSLTGDSAFGFPGFFMGVRKEYAEAHEFYHEQHPDQLKYSFPQETRPFPVPEPMWTNREEKPDGRRHFDVVIASDFRLLGGTNMSNMEEIKAQKKHGLKTGLVQLARYDINLLEVINPKVRQQIDGDRVQMLVYGEKISCDVLIVRHPPALQDWQKYVPDIDARHVLVIVNQPPKKEYSEGGTTLYNLEQTRQNLERYFGKKGIWYPIGPLIREKLENSHKEELKNIDLADKDWVNIIDTAEWKRAARPAPAERVRIGRHSRSQYVKWPSNPDQLMKVYPESENYEIHVLGGAEAPEKVLGRIPSNWQVAEFGEIEPREFLAGLDVFVYYTHPDWVEAFGRVIFEAMAVGVPVIIPPSYRQLFGEAAIYAEPEQVLGKISQLMADAAAYEQQVETAREYVETRFGYTQHLSRLEEFFHGR